MKLRILIAAFALACLLGREPSLAQNAYITTSTFNSVSVIDTATNKVAATISVGVTPFGVAVTRDGSKVFVVNANFPSNSVSVIDTATNMVTATIPVGSGDVPEPRAAAVTPDGSKVYVTNANVDTVSVINTELSPHFGDGMKDQAAAWG